MPISGAYAETSRSECRSDKDDDNGDKILKPLSEWQPVYPERTLIDPARSRPEVRGSGGHTDGGRCRSFRTNQCAGGEIWRMLQATIVVAGCDTETGSCSRNVPCAAARRHFIYLILASQSGRHAPLALMLSLPLSRFRRTVMLYFTRDTLNIRS